MSETHIMERLTAEIRESGESLKVMSLHAQYSLVNAQQTCIQKTHRLFSTYFLPRVGINIIKSKSMYLFILHPSFISGAKPSITANHKKLKNPLESYKKKQGAGHIIIKNIKMNDK